MNAGNRRVSISQGGNRKKQPQTSDKASTPPPSAEPLTAKLKQKESENQNKFFHHMVAKELQKLPKTPNGPAAAEKPAVTKSKVFIVPRRIKSTGQQSDSQIANSSSSSTSKEEESHSVKKELRKKKATIKKKRPSPEQKTAKTAESGNSTAVEDISEYELSTKQRTPIVAKTPSNKLANSKNKFPQVVKAFMAHCNRMTVPELYRQFNFLPDPTKDECKAYLDVKNSGKNRYNDIYCLDKNRIELNFLASREDGGYSRYIHANRVQHDTLAQQFIITQGPKKTTVVDLWRMVWQEEVMFIIMLCKFVEDNRPKCSPYFLEEIGACVCHGPLEITTTSRQENEGITLTTLKVFYKGEERNVTHLLFPHWRDHEAPSPTDFDHLFDLLQGVRGSPTPVVVHCSAGVGRSGTLVALEMLLMDAMKMREVNVPKTVSKLRANRCFAVQTFSQYMCLFLAVLHFGKKHGVLQEAEILHFRDLIFAYYQQKS